MLNDIAKSKRTAHMCALSALLLCSLPASAELEPISGVVKAKHEALLSVDLRARVLSTPRLTGEYFKADEVLLEFDCERQLAEVAAARAAHSAAKAAYRSNVEMQTYGAVGKFEVNASKAEMAQADARARAVAAGTKDCILKAPFDGKVAELGINVFETPRSDQPIMKIISTDALELRLIVPSQWLAWLVPGNTLQFNVDETGKRYSGKVVRVGAEVDAVSRTVPIIAHFDSSPEGVLPGMSGIAVFDQALAQSDE